MPPVIVWTVGAVGAALVARLLGRQWQRVNDDLDRLRSVPVGEGERETLQTLRRDPRTGVYRP